jgi:hypothetical protein
VTTAATLEGSAGGLPERAGVYWRQRVSEGSLRSIGRRWTFVTAMHTLPLIAAAAALGVLKPLVVPVSLVLLAHAWWIPELYAARGAGVLRPRGCGAAAGGADRRALLLLGDLIDERARALHAETGVVLEPGKLGAWILGEAGAVLVRPGGRRVYCYCVKATGADLPACDRIAHLLLALRCDEQDFATVANLAFSGASWRLRRRLRTPQRRALCAARDASR